MTVIEIKKQDEEYTMTMNGHSGYGEYGKDIVCASISTLAFTWINQLQEFERINFAKITQLDMRDGEIFLRFKSSKDVVLWAFKTIITGFLMLEEKFPQNLSVIRGEL